MIILAADTSTPIITVCAAREDHILAETVVHGGRKHAERLLDTVDWVLDQAGLSPDRIDALAVSRGPGSFTGLRVGIAAWKGLALGWRRPLVGVPTLDALGRAVPTRDGWVCTLLDAKMGEVFGAVYEFREGRRHKRMEDRVGPVEALLEDVPEGALFLGDGADRYRSRIEARRPGAVFAPPYASVPRASLVAAEARARLEAGDTADAGAVNPVYLRQSQPEETRKKAVTP